MQLQPFIYIKPLTVAFGFLSIEEQMIKILSKFMFRLILREYQYVKYIKK